MATIPEYEIHELASLFPVIAADRERIKEGIREHGFNPNHPILIGEGKIVDGRTRYEICKELGVMPTFKVLHPEADLIQEVIDANLNRRHLAEGQLADLAEEMANLKHGTNRHAKKVEVSTDTSTSESRPVMTLDEAAAKVGASKASVHRIRRAKKTATEKTKAAIKDGTLSIRKAEEIAKLGPDEQDAKVDEIREEKEAKKDRPKTRKEKASEKTAGKLPKTATVVKQNWILNAINKAVALAPETEEKWWNKLRLTPERKVTLRLILDVCPHLNYQKADGKVWLTDETGRLEGTKAEQIKELAGKLSDYLNSTNFATTRRQDVLELCRPLLKLINQL